MPDRSTDKLHCVLDAKDSQQPPAMKLYGPDRNVEPARQVFCSQTLTNEDQHGLLTFGQFHPLLWCAHHSLKRVWQVPSS